ncbi:MAG: hypothetical protein RLZZ461_763 [Planctomycetota bacterium]|jgi:hypothetical protein
MTGPTTSSAWRGVVVAGCGLAAALFGGCGDEGGPDGAGSQRPGIGPGVPAFAEEAVARGVNFTLESGDDGGPKLFPEIMPGGVAIADLDGDDDLDLYFIQFGPIEPEREGDHRNRLYLNRGDGTFEDATDGSGAEDDRLGCGVATGDYDGDGDVDLYVTNLGRNTLLRNDGAGRFTDVTEDAGVGESGWGASAAFLDHDLDGDLDLFVCNYVAWSPEREIECRDHNGRRDYCSPKAYEARTPDVLYRNNGDGTFTDVSAEAGIDVVQGNGLGVVWGDFDGNGAPDIFVANDGNPNHLFLGRGDGTFEEAAKARGVYLAGDGNTRAGMGTAIGDPDEDGDLDILVVNLIHQFDSFFRNENGFFVEDTASTGLSSITRRTTRFGVGWFDVDNDSHLDLFEASGRVMVRKDAPEKGDRFAENNHLLLGLGDGKYEKVAPVDAWGDGLVHTSRGAAFGDLDGDGGVDVVVVNRDAPAYVLRNVSPRGAWCAVRVLDDHGAPALGATVLGTVGDRRLRRDQHAAYGYLTSNEPVARFGLDADTRLQDVEVRWPDGRTVWLGDLDAGRVHVVRPPAAE